MVRASALHSDPVERYYGRKGIRFTAKDACLPASVPACVPACLTKAMAVNDRLQHAKSRGKLGKSITCFSSSTMRFSLIPRQALWTGPTTKKLHWFPPIQTMQHPAPSVDGDILVSHHASTPRLMRVLHRNGLPRSPLPQTKSQWTERIRANPSTRLLPVLREHKHTASPPIDNHHAGTRHGPAQRWWASRRCVAFLHDTGKKLEFMKPINGTQSFRWYAPSSPHRRITNTWIRMRSAKNSYTKASLGCKKRIGLQPAPRHISAFFLQHQHQHQHHHPATTFFSGLRLWVSSGSDVCHCCIFHTRHQLCLNPSASKGYKVSMLTHTSPS